MRSGFESFSTALGDLSDPANPYRNLPSVQFEKLVRAQRAVALGDALGNLVLWLIRAPKRLRTVWMAQATPRVQRI